jgi:hypothetical protein
MEMSYSVSTGLPALAATRQSVAIGTVTSERKCGIGVSLERTVWLYVTLEKLALTKLNHRDTEVLDEQKKKQLMRMRKLCQHKKDLQQTDWRMAARDYIMDMATERKMAF